jgi:UDP-glucose 4-epimerase
MVYAGSGAVRYGAQARLSVDESNHVDPLSPHAAGKLAGEMYLRAYAEMYGVAPICLALANVYGPRQNPHGAAGVIPVLAIAVITGHPFAVYTDGADAHDYVYGDDVVDAFVRAGFAPTETTGTYNIGTGQKTTMTEMHALMSAVVDGAGHPHPASTRTAAMR